MEDLIDFLKVLIPLLLGGSFISLLTFKLTKRKMLAESAKTEAEVLKIDAETESISIGSLEKVVTAQTKEIERIQKGLDEMARGRHECDEKYETLENEFKSFKTESANRLKTLKKLEKDSSALKNELLKVKSEKRELENKVRDLTTENIALAERISELEKHEAE